MTVCNIRLGRTLFIVVLLCFSVAVQSRAQPSGALQTPAEMMALVQVPRDVPGMLQNMKVAVERGLLMDDAFYTDEVLKRYLGGRRLGWAYNDSERGKRVEMSDFDNFVQPLSVGRHLVPGLSVHVFQMYKRSTGERSGSVSIGISGTSNTDLDIVQHIFGSAWQRPPPGPPLGGHLYTIEYTGTTRQFHWLTTFRFQSSRMLESADFVVKGPELR